MPDRLLTSAELAEALQPRYSVHTIRQLAREGVIPRRRQVGRWYLYDLSEVQEVLNNRIFPHRSKRQSSDSSTTIDPLEGCGI